MQASELIDVNDAVMSVDLLESTDSLYIANRHSQAKQIIKALTNHELLNGKQILGEIVNRQTGRQHQNEVGNM